MDAPALPVSGNCRHGFDPTFSGNGFGRWDTESVHPNRTLFDGLLGQCPRPALHRLVPFFEGLGNVRALDAWRSWDQPCDEVCARPPSRSGGLCPTADSAADDCGGIFDVIEWPCCYEPGESSFHLQAVRLGVSEGGE